MTPRHAGTPVPLSAEERERFARDGLYRPEMEHESCGVGFVAHVRGLRSHGLVREALTVLENLEHRGAAAADPTTGDGAGLLLQIPHALLAEECAARGLSLGAEGTYGVGMCFLPDDDALAARTREIVRAVVEDEKQYLLGFRVVPTQRAALGAAARASLPRIEQVLIGPGTLPADDDALERKLYVIRKRIETEARKVFEDREYPYFASLSTRTIVYKGLLTPEQLPRFYTDLADPRLTSAIAVLHQRFSTNTFPSWTRAHPYRRIAHNGEINTLRGNVSWMRAREDVLRSPTFADDVSKLLPIVDTRGSDSAMFDDVLELLVHTGRSLPHAVRMMVPEAWHAHAEMSAERRAFYEYHACVMEPWDGPACIVFSDGRVVGAVLDRNGLRPARFVRTSDDLVVLASEVGVRDARPEDVVSKDRLSPGRVLLVDTTRGLVLDDEALVSALAARRPYARWMSESRVRLEELRQAKAPGPLAPERRRRLARAHGVTTEELARVLAPMASTGEEAVGSMGNDAPPAALSSRPVLLSDYFRQLFAQVTNPPVDPLRESLVMSLCQLLGPEANLFEESPLHARKLELRTPVLLDLELATLRVVDAPGLRATTVDCTVPVADVTRDAEAALARLATDACAAVEAGATILVLSDRAASRERLAVPSLLAVSAVHRGLLDAGLRQRCGLVVECADARDVHQVALLVAFGAGAVNPYLALDLVRELVEKGDAEGPVGDALARYRKALEKGLLKVLSKMGISTVQSYRGAQIVECVGLSTAFVDKWLGGVPAHAGGLGLTDVLGEALARHDAAWRKARLDLAEDELPAGGVHAWRRDGERHAWNPATLGLLQHAVRSADYGAFKRFTKRADEDARLGGLLRGMLEPVPAAAPVPLDEVEPASSIVKRFKTGAMSYGSISREAHEALAVAMNRLGARSNTGEGGERPDRGRDPARRSAIRQVASGRFGVTIDYLAGAEELQIKIAQGAKPGEGGQLPGHKVDAEIARTRHATPGVTLVSPPPHHDIYSIEDLAQLIFDLKNAQPAARISVKLVAEAGVGTVAAGVAKAKADLIVIAGDAGGTGAAPLSSIKHAGIPWELGLAEAQQTLVLNGLRSRVRLETDGQLKTGRDVVVAALLGAEEFAFGTASLVSMGCVMMRVCHLNTCPVGVATQDPALRARFAGEPEHVIAFFTFLAEEVRELMAELGARTFDALVGRVESLRVRADLPGGKAQRLALSRLLVAPPKHAVRRQTELHDHQVDLVLDTVLVEQARPALEHGERVELDMPIRNVHRTTGTLLSSVLVRKHGPEGLPDGSIALRFTGSAGQSFGAFLASGIELRLAGDANDGMGKGLSGGRIVVVPPEGSTFVPEENVAVGNVALYGATSGEVFVRGRAGERFAVRNSGATAVVEGLGDHGCEYMTGGRVVVLGSVGRNFAAGMSGGVAWVLDDGTLAQRVNPGSVELAPLLAEDRELVRSLVHRHYTLTMSALAWRVLSGFQRMSRRFVRVMSVEYKRALAAGTVRSAEGTHG